MAASSSTVLGYVTTLFSQGTLAGVSDGELLGRFLTREPESPPADAEVVFSALLVRHGPMVWRVCRSLVLDEHDAEDAFQATFLLLIRKAGSLKVKSSLGPWLYSAAYRIGLSTRAEAARRVAIRRAEASRRPADCSPDASQALTLDSEALAHQVHREIMRLPERFRAATVLCDIEGLSYQEAADRLGVPLGTLQSRLARARRRLRDRMRRAGIASNCVVGQRPLDHRSIRQFEVPAGLFEGTTRTIVTHGFGAAGLDGIGSELLPHLVKTALRPAVPFRSFALALVATSIVAVCGAFALPNQAASKSGTSAVASSPQKQATANSAQGPRGPRNVGLLYFPPPSELKAAAGRGKALVYEVDQDGNRVKAAPEIAARRKRVRKRAGVNANVARKRVRKRALVNRDVDERPDKEVLRELRWAVVTGVVDHRAIRASLMTMQLAFAPDDAKKKVEADRRHWPQMVYRRVDVERQARDASGVWSDWAAVDVESNCEILDNLPEVDAERTDDRFRLAALVDPLPFLKEGDWSGTDVERFAVAGPPVEDESATPSNDRRAVQEVTEPELMLRSLDFTVEQGRTYRYRVRLIFWLPRVPDVPGPWSQPTEPVTIP